MTPTSQPTSRSMRRIVAASLVGTMVEWYDYFIFGTASALVFGKIFFPALSSTGGTLASFALFSVGFFVRPVGAAIFGHFGDRIGRKSVLVVSLAIMSSGTFLIGVLPTAESIGVWAPVLLVCLRVLQGLGVAGEWGGAQLMMVEHAPSHRRGFYGSVPQIGNVLGLLLATATFSVLALLPQAQFLAWGWRVPFIASIVLLGVGIYIRLQIVESPLFENARQEAQLSKRVPIVELFRNYPTSVLRGVCLRFCVDVQGYIIITFSLSYLTGTLGMPEYTGTAATAVAACGALITAPVFGALSDRVGRRGVYAAGAVLGAVLAFPFFWLLQTQSVVLVIIAFVLLYSLSNFSCNGVLGTYLAEMFPTRIRYSGVSCTYHMTSIVGGSLAPLIATSLIAWSGGATWPVALYLIGAAGVSLIAIPFTKETAKASLHESTPSPPNSTSPISR